MLVELVVENYAVIERLRVRFHPGLNLLTGETGSGKSIVVDALGLLLGGRAAGDMVRTGAERARISGIFEAGVSRRLRQVLEAAGVEIEDGELLIEREILAGGKSRAFAGSRPVTASLLRELAPHLGDIHGQHEQQRLFDADAQIEMLDAFAGSADLVAEVADLYLRWRSCRRELDELERNEQEKLRLADLWGFQRREIEEASPKPGEDAELESERRRLLNFAKLEENAASAYEALYESPESAIARMRHAARRLDELARIDPSLGALGESLKSAEFSVEEAAYSLRDYLSHLEGSPGRLEEVETRLAAIEKLKRKYGQTTEQVLAYLEEVRGQLAALENTESRRAALNEELRSLAAAYEAAAARLSDRRKDAAHKLEKRVETELSSLAMERTAFRVRVGPAAWSEHGVDEVCFLVSPNVGEEPRTLEKVASGGEISRIALALKTCVAAGAGKTTKGEGAPRTLVFDEVDAGIGGRAAEVVGRRLKDLAASSQVLCVTHLPQIAAFADHHYYVEKKEANGRTVATILELTGDSRTREVGRMLSGEKLTPEALKHAEKLIQAGSAGKRGA
ncbi:MAG TPA: DNA repair protein RecN [Bryobacteraceae bacterium]|nr:DNA repair protein RecN [Bryobacteraceae bacterium]